MEVWRPNPVFSLTTITTFEPPSSSSGSGTESGLITDTNNESSAGSTGGASESSGQATGGASEATGHSTGGDSSSSFDKSTASDDFSFSLLGSYSSGVESATTGGGAGAGQTTDSLLSMTTDSPSGFNPGPDGNNGSGSGDNGT
ncbi:unnamed protein product, partial [Candida parapsilosis]